jgi:Tfp pilus assembly protein PilF
MVYFKKNNLDSAAWCLEHVIALDPLHPQANNNLSLLYMQLNRKQEARNLFESMQQRGVDIPAQFREFVESKK